MNKDKTMLEEKVVSLEDEDKLESPVLLDETDVVIEDFKQRLKNLQSRLYQKQANRDHEREVVAKIAAHLSHPAKNLSVRLQKMLGSTMRNEQGHDELEACVQTANTLHAFLEKIGDAHSNLMHALMGEGRLLPLRSFDNEMHTHVVDINCSYADVLGANPLLANKQIDGAIFSMIAVFLEAIREILGYRDHVRIHCMLKEEKGKTTLGMQILGQDALCTAHAKQHLLSDYAWDALGDGKASVALLYAEKILEIKRGHFSFLRKGDNVHGIHITIPVID